MWKLLVGFIVFAGFGLFFMFKAGDKVEMGGEKHGVESHAPAATSSPAPAPGASAAK